MTSREDIIEEIFKLKTSDEESEPDLLEHLNTALLSKLLGLRERLKGLRRDKIEILAGLKDIEESLISRASYHVIDKYKVNISDTEKIVRLILSVTGRLININNDLKSLSWTCIQERDLLEQKKGKLMDQLEETKALWKNVDRRTSTVLRNIEHYLDKGEGRRFSEMIQRNIKNMVEERDLEEKIRISEKQLGAMKVMETFEVIV